MREILIPNWDPDCWDYTGNSDDNVTPTETCQLCGQHGLRYHFEIRHIFEGTHIWIGSECIKDHLPEYWGAVKTQRKEMLRQAKAAEEEEGARDNMDLHNMKLCLLQKWSTPSEPVHYSNTYAKDTNQYTMQQGIRRVAITFHRTPLGIWITGEARRCS